MPHMATPIGARGTREMCPQVLTYLGTPPRLGVLVEAQHGVQMTYGIPVPSGATSTTVVAARVCRAVDTYDVGHRLMVTPGTDQ